MKSFIVALCVIAVAAASSSDETAQVLRSDYHQNPNGDFNYAVENDNGITFQAAGVVKNLGKDEVALEITGSSRYESPEGQTFALTYKADENGYVAQGAHLPTPPAPEPIPEYILRSLQYIAEHPYVEKKL